MALARFALNGGNRFEAVTGARTRIRRGTFQLVAPPQPVAIAPQHSVFTAFPAPIPRTVNPIASRPRSIPFEGASRVSGPLKFNPVLAGGLPIPRGPIGGGLRGPIVNPSGRPRNAPRPLKGPDQRGRPVSTGKVGKGQALSGLAKDKKPGRAGSAQAKARKPGQPGVFEVGTPAAKVAVVAGVIAIVTLPFLPGVLVL